MKDNLKYKYALTKGGELVSAEKLSKELRLAENNEFYIEGNLSNGEKALLPVMAVIGDKKKPHFRCFTDPKKQIEGFIHNKEYFGEVVLHKLAKKIVASMANMILPDCIFSSTYTKLIVSNSRFFQIKQVEIEKAFETPKGSIRYDAFITSDTGEQLGFEVLVTHAVDEVKRDKILELGHEVIELDLSDLIDKVDSIDIEQEITNRILTGRHMTWVVNKNYNKLLAWKQGLVKMAINRAAHTYSIGSTEEKDAWFTWAADYSYSIPKCPYIKSLIDSEKTHVTKDRYLESNQCKQCGRCIVISNNTSVQPKNICGYMLCNQSDIDNQDILSILASGIYNNLR